VAAAFEQILKESGAIHILVNNVWGGDERMVDSGEFTWPRPFWQQPLWRWDAMFDAGVRAHYHASQLAAPSMIAQGRGLIVNISSFAARKHAGNVAYGVSKAATDKMAADMASELKRYGVTVVSLYPGLVRTEKVHGSGTVARLDQFGIARVHWTGCRRARHGCGCASPHRKRLGGRGARQGVRLH
jgi:dehydrogenase/reductase SDR family protein 1